LRRTIDEVKARLSYVAGPELTACLVYEISTRTGPRGNARRGRNRGRRGPISAVGCTLATGVSCSVHGPRGQWSLTSFASPRGGSAAERRILATLPDCQLVACAIHYTAARIARRGADWVGPLRRIDGAPSRVLSDRESQCLIQSAGGKTTSEIGRRCRFPSAPSCSTSPT
jgi:hypothetical protein